jgi:CHAT domain-containing protein
VARAYNMTTLPPVWRVVRDVLEGSPPVDWVHVALHGQFDPQGDEDGLVLLDGSPPNLVQQFLTTRQIQSFELAQRPFVFLNACQVGSGNRVLGSYAGMSVALLRGGATAVVAPQWNIDDDVAGEVTDTFYQAVLGDAPVSVAEALRAIRSTYTEENVTADPARFTPTLIAYQLFGHPRLTLHRASAN